MQVFVGEDVCLHAIEMWLAYDEVTTRSEKESLNCLEGACL